MKKTLISLLFCTTFTLVRASGLEITNVQLNYVNTDQGLREFSGLFTVSWRNAWRTDRNHDAAWVFCKLLKDGGGPHLKIDPTRLEIIGTGRTPAVEGTLRASADSLGFYVYPSGKHRGDLTFTIKAHFLRPAPDFPVWEYELAVYGIEMVYIPEGPVTLGDPDTTALQYNAFYRSDATGGYDGLYRITSEAAIEVGRKAGALDYRSDEPVYNGDRGGPIPAAFPKGYRAFYIMKYELTQGQYADFLNGIGQTAAFHRANFGGPGYYEERGSIRYEDGRYVAGSPHRPLNFVSWADGVAFADWAALRPMTEFEYTKACRGPQAPVPHEYPWGTGGRDQIARVVDDADDELKFIRGYTEADLSDATRPYLGASYYWVMDLAGSVWEKVITPGNELGRQFTGRHGDGRLGYLGKCNVEGWPTDNDHEGGYGYRGGGYYDAGMSFSAFNPYSPVAYRVFGSWSGGPRYISYGFRCVRTE